MITFKDEEIPCKSIRKICSCPQNDIVKITSKSDWDITNIFEQTKCYSLAVSNLKNLYKKLFNRKLMFTVLNETNVRLFCNNKQETLKLKDVGIIKIPINCHLEHDDTQIFFLEEENLSIMSQYKNTKIKINNLVLKTTIHNHTIILDNFNSINKLDLHDIYVPMRNISSQIKDIVHENWTLSISITSIVLLIIILFVLTKLNVWKVLKIKQNKEPIERNNLSRSLRKFINKTEAEYMQPQQL